MASSTNKKVLVERFDREPLTGFVSPQSYLQEQGVELLSTTGTMLLAPYPEVKAICFLRDFEHSEVWKPKRFFSTRPKMEGLWVRAQFRDGDAIDGVLSSNLLLLDPAGFSLIPPNPSFQNQRVFVPRGALSSIQILGVVGTPFKRPRKSKLAIAKDQIELFE